MKVGDKVVCMFTYKGSVDGFIVYGKQVYSVNEYNPLLGSRKGAIKIKGSIHWWGLKTSDGRVHFRKIEPNFTNAITKELANKQLSDDDKVKEFDERELQKEVPV